MLPSLVAHFSLRPLPRDPDSCPTRRSSDLFRRRQHDPPCRSRGCLALIARSKRQLRNFTKRSRLETSGRDRLVKFLDRKSTRLNYSHRCISYAVFCLKKKFTAVIQVLTQKV